MVVTSDMSPIALYSIPVVAKLTSPAWPCISRPKRSRKEEPTGTCIPAVCAMSWSIPLWAEGLSIWEDGSWDTTPDLHEAGQGSCDLHPAVTLC